MNEAPKRAKVPGDVLVRMTGIGKCFGEVRVLHGVDLEVRSGEVLVLAGENGAGKSTLIKILGGAYSDFTGRIEIGGMAVRPHSPHEANALGIAVIFQELSLVPSMTVADNLFLGHPATRLGWMRDGEQLRRAEAVLQRWNLPIAADRTLGELSIGEQQLVEIAKALTRQARVLVMDEPTSALGAVEVERLFGLVSELKAQGCGIVYITHRMEEIERIADRITVLRDGRTVGTAAAVELPPHRLVEWMVGETLDVRFPTRGAGLSDRDRLQVRGLTLRRRGGGDRPSVADLHLDVRVGEILGLAGLPGSGIGDLLRALFGVYDGVTEGEVRLEGEPWVPAGPRQAIARGVALLTNDRKATGLVMSLSILANATLAVLPGCSPGGWRSAAREREAGGLLGRRLDLRATSWDQEVGALSGGNQQKVALGKWLLTEPKLLLLDEPTRGIDVGAKREIYRLVTGLADRGVTVLLVTSELPELLALSDRVVVLHRGRLTGEYGRGEATAARVMRAAMG